MIGQERLNRLEGKIDAINENVQGTTPANPQAPTPDPQMDPSSNGTGSARPVFTQQTANDLEQINKGDAMSNVLFNKQQGASMKINPPKADNTRVKLPTGFKSNEQLKGERDIQERIKLEKSINPMVKSMKNILDMKSENRGENDAYNKMMQKRSSDAIAKAMKSGASMKKDDMKEVVQQLKGASKMHAQQAKKIQSLVKSKK